MIFSKGYAFLCEANSGFANILSSTEAVIADWGQPGLYPATAKSHWVKMGSGIAETSNLDLWAERILPTLEQTFVLVTSDGDMSVPDNIRPETLGAILSHPNLVRWYAQNLNEIHGDLDPRLVALPIGLDVHTPSNIGVWRCYMADLAKRAARPTPSDALAGKIFIDFGINKTSDLRGELVKRLRWHRGYRILQRRVSKSKLLDLYGSHGYVLSVRGNGFDCHRTWEALAIGARVIAYTPEINSMLARYGVFTFSELADLNSPDLRARAAQHYEANPPRIPSFRDALRPEDHSFFNWEQPHVG